MYYMLLVTHSWVRWILLITLIVSVTRAFYGWKAGVRYSREDNFLRIGTVSLAHLQLLLGLWLYWVSPTVQYFLQNFRAAVHERDPRFFGMEHITMMTIAVVLLTVGSIKSRRAMDDANKFRKMAVWGTIVLLIIFFSIPWEFSPFTSRPYFRI